MKDVILEVVILLMVALAVSTPWRKDPGAAVLLAGIAALTWAHNFGPLS